MRRQVAHGCVRFLSAGAARFGKGRRWIVAVAALLALGAAPAAVSAQGFGAWTPGDPYAGHTNGADALEAATGRRVQIVNWFQGWAGGDWNSGVQPQSLHAV